MITARDSVKHTSELRICIEVAHKQKGVYRVQSTTQPSNKPLMTGLK